LAETETETETECMLQLGAHGGRHGWMVLLQLLQMTQGEPERLRHRDLVHAARLAHGAQAGSIRHFVHVLSIVRKFAGFANSLDFFRKDSHF
jgi:hypothetical protein